MANSITGIRIACSIALLFCPAFSPAFYTLYIIAGVSDMIDGTVARKTGTVSEFGSKLDTVADLILVIVCLIKLLPVLHVATWLIIWIIVIAVIKVINLLSGYVLRKEIVVLWIFRCGGAASPEQIEPPVRRVLSRASGAS